MMKLFGALILLLSLSTVLAAEPHGVKRHVDANGIITVVGVLSTDSFPYRLTIQASTKNNETLFIENLSAEDSILYSGVIVTIRGKLIDRPSRQYAVEVIQVREAKPDEEKKVFLQKF